VSRSQGSYLISPLLGSHYIVIETATRLVLYTPKSKKLLIQRGKKTKTYNRRDSQMVTHSSTSRPVQCLCMAERTGCPVLTDLWSYVSESDRVGTCSIRSGWSPNRLQQRVRLWRYARCIICARSGILSLLIASSVHFHQWETRDLVQMIRRYSVAWLLATGRLGSEWCPGSNFQTWVYSRRLRSIAELSVDWLGQSIPDVLLAQSS
jgi:hypothetical protein